MLSYDDPLPNVVLIEVKAEDTVLDACKRVIPHTVMKLLQRSLHVELENIKVRYEVPEMAFEKPPVVFTMKRDQGKG